MTAARSASALALEPVSTRCGNALRTLTMLNEVVSMRRAL